MNVAISEAKAQLTDLVRRAESGGKVVLTRHGQPVARIEPVKRVLTPEERRAAFDRAIEMARETMLPGPPAARAADFLYDEDGLAI